MSRIGRQPVAVANNVEVNIGEANAITVKGPKGTLSRQFPLTMVITRDGENLVVARPNDEGKQRALHGLSRTLLSNMAVGVTAGWPKVKAAARLSVYPPLLSETTT